jgi:hypothetical protein
MTMRMLRKLRPACLFVAHQDSSSFPANPGCCAILRAIARPAVFGSRELSPLQGSMSLRLQSE